MYDASFTSNYLNQPPLSVTHHIGGRLFRPPSTRILTAAPIPLYPKHITIPIYLMKKGEYYALVPPSYINGRYILSNPKYKDWSLLLTFYVLSYKIIPPLPYGFNVYRITNNKNSPYQTRSIEWVENIYKYPEFHTENSFTIVTYRYQVENTIPLYLYKNPGMIISLKQLDSLKEHKLHPLFVMDKKYTKFSCKEGICTPSGFLSKKNLVKFNNRLKKLIEKITETHKKLTEKIQNDKKILNGSSKEYQKLVQTFSDSLDYDYSYYYPPGHFILCRQNCNQTLKQKNYEKIYPGPTIVEPFYMSKPSQNTGYLLLIALLIVTGFIILKQFKIF